MDNVLCAVERGAFIRCETKEEVTQLLQLLMQCGYVWYPKFPIDVMSFTNTKDDVFPVHIGKHSVKSERKCIIWGYCRDTKRNDRPVVNYSEIVEALDTPSEVCHWCDITEYESVGIKYDKFSHELELSSGDFTILQMLWDCESNDFGICAAGENKAIVKIAFCPKCGRDLRHSVGHNKGVKAVTVFHE